MFEEETVVPQMSQEEIDLRNELNKEVFEGAEGIEALPPAQAASEEDAAALEAAKKAEQEKEVDPWEGVAPVLRQAIESIQSRLGGFDAFGERLKQAENRVGGIDNRLRDMKAAFPAAKQPTRQDVEAALASNAGFKVFSEDFPDHANAFKEILIATSSGAGPAGMSMEDVQKMRDEMNTNFEERLNKQQLGFELKLLRSKYKNHVALIKEPTFEPWLQTQSPEMKAKFGSFDALDGIDLLDEYTAYKAKAAALPNTAKERQDRLALAAENKRTTTAVKQKSEADMTEAEYRDHVSKQIWGK